MADLVWFGDWGLGLGFRILCNVLCDGICTSNIALGRCVDVELDNMFVVFRSAVDVMEAEFSSLWKSLGEHKHTFWKNCCVFVR
ncbi:hypothetical protein M758_6G026100 [Ceratodon purpureus]|nr:hypothetical protein M758_6G026100 [Ceratodon purpureus]